MVSIAYLRNPSPGVNYHRLEIPMSLLAGEGYSVTETDIYDMSKHSFDVVIFNRIPYQPYSNFVELKKRGVKIIFDIDDYWVRPEWHSNYSPQYEPSFNAEIIKYLRLADVVWVSTPYLQRLCAEMLIKTHLVPNALLYTEPQFKPMAHSRDHLTCGWVGTPNHQRDFGLMARPMYTAGQLPVEMVLAGVNTLDTYWQYLGQVLGGGNYKKVKYIKAQTAYDYGVLYNELDMVLLPSFDCTYTLCKSNLKLLEAGAFSLPVLTNGGIYKEVNNKIGVRIESERDWVKGIKKLAGSRRMRQELGQALNEYTRTKYDIQKINEIRKQTIND